MTSVTEMILGVLTESREFVFRLALNFAVILGVIVSQWSVTDIAVIYVSELIIISVVFFPVALFAPQPVADRDGDAWKRKPTPIRPISLFPPVYWRNVTFVGSYAVFAGSLFALIGLVVRNAIFELISTLSLWVGVAIAGTFLYHLRRVWRRFIAEKSYRQKSPKDAIEFAFAPVVEILFIMFYAFIPVTFLVVGTAIVMNTDVTSRLVLLGYLVPIGAIQAWIRSLDPQTDDLEISVVDERRK